MLTVTGRRYLRRPWTHLCHDHGGRVTPAPLPFAPPRQPAALHHASQLTPSFLSGQGRSFAFHGSGHALPAGADAPRARQGWPRNDFPAPPWHGRWHNGDRRGSSRSGGGGSHVPPRAPHPSQPRPSSRLRKKKKNLRCLQRVAARSFPPLFPTLPRILALPAQGSGRRPPASAYDVPWPTPPPSLA